MNWNQRLTQARESKNLGKSDFAKLVGVSAPTVTNWESGKVESIKGENLVKTCRVLGVTEEWLMNGADTGRASAILSAPPSTDMPASGLPSAEHMAPFTPQRVTVGNPSTDVIPIKLVNLRVQAGYPRFEADEIFDDLSTIDLPRQWVEENNLVPNCLLAIRVTGQSMEPMLYEDEKIVINIADTKPVSNQIYAVNFDGKAIVKQMVYKNREWWLYSFNQDDEFRPVMCRGAECIVIGKMVYQPGRSLIGKL